MCFSFVVNINPCKSVLICVYDKILSSQFSPKAREFFLYFIYGFSVNSTANKNPCYP